MIRPKADRLFARFRRTGDPQLLARVFDRTAPELARVASYLCRDRNDAEDAVQSAFTAALEHRQEWDGARPLLPWLLGLLANRVQQQRRAAQRQPDPARLPERAPVPPPSAVAAAREFELVFQRALAQVPEPFCTVLRHHLVDGEAPFEIADRLGLPAATVRTRLHRGLDQLRARLPAGAGALLAVPLLLPADAMAAVRQRVLSTVPGGAAVPATSAAATGLLAIAGASVLLTVGLGWWWQTARGDAAQLGKAAVGSPSAAFVASDPMRAAPLPGATSGSAERIPVPIGNGQSGTVRLLVRHAVTKAPLVDVPVQVAAVQVAPATEPNLATAELPAPVTSTADDPPRVAQVRTDASGRGSVTLRAGTAEVVVLGHAAERSQVVVPGNGAVDCTVEVPVSFTADVKVVDADGLAVGGARILGEPDGFAREDRIAPIELGRTAADGHWRSPRTEYTLAVWAAADGRADAAPVWIGDGRQAELRLGGASVPLAGRVVDADGVPVEGARILWVPDGHEVLAARWCARTARDGSFELHGRSGGRHHVLVQPAAASSPALATTMNVPATGDRDWTIRLPAPAQLAVAVRRSGGAACANASVLATFTAPELPSGLRTRLAHSCQTNGNGELLLEALAPGRWQIELCGGWGQTAVTTVELAAGSRERLLHTFADLTELVVEVVDGAGAPQAGLRVQIATDGEGLRTDANGQVRLPGVGPGAHAVVVTAATNTLPIVQQRVVTGAVARIVVPTSPAAGRLRGRLQAGAGIELSSLLLMLQPAKFDPRALQRVADVTLDEATGAFATDELPAGSYVLTVLDGTTLAAVHGPIEIAAVVGGAESASRPIDLGVIEVGSGELRVHADGSGSDQMQFAIGLVGVDVFEPVAVGSVPARTKSLPAGRWRALLWGPSTLPAVAELEVRTGAVAEVRVTSARGVPTTLRLPDAGFGVLTWTMPDGSVLRLMVVGNREFVRGAPAGHHRVELVLQSGGVFAAEFEVGDAAPAPVELQAAAPR